MSREEEEISEETNGDVVGEDTLPVLDEAPKNDNDVIERYLLAFYFMITTMTTVGYGDISGTNTTERIYCIILMLIGVLTFSYATGMLT